MKDEGPFILEWVAYHKLIGINDIIVFSNDCQDGTDQILERLDEMGVIRHLPNPSMFTQSTRHHWQVINYVNTFPRLRRSDWIVSMDADEFVCIRTGNGQIEDLFNAVPDADVISFNQLNFGSSGRNRALPGLQMRHYRHSQDYEGTHRMRISRRGVKTLTSQRAKYTRFGNHSPIFDKKTVRGLSWVNGGGQSLGDLANGSQIKSLMAPHYSYDLIQLNHYAVRSIENFLVQKDRGNANHADRSADLRYWLKYDVNQIENTEILRHADVVQEQIDEWCQDPELNDLQEKTVAFHADWIARLREEEENHALFMKCVRAHKRMWLNPQNRAEDAEDAA
ncbi:MAG: glycosyltransferase family 2 protein [Pseudomonadota bacterium]